ncbi:unnamed protein product [Boreogadus saida]
MDADQCQGDSNTMSGELESSLENMDMSETKEQEEPSAVVEEPELVVVNGHPTAELSPVNKQNDGFPELPESVVQSAETPETKAEETSLMETVEQGVPLHVSEKAEEPVGTEAPSEAVLAQPQPVGSPEKVSEAPEQEMPTNVPEIVEEPLGEKEISEVVPTQPQLDGSPEKVSSAPEQYIPQDTSEKVEESMGVEELSKAVLTQCPPAGSPETVSPPDVITMGTELEKLQLEQQLSVESDPEPKVEELVPELVDQTSPDSDRVVPLVEIHKEEMPAPTVEVLMDTPLVEMAVENVIAIESPKEKAVVEFPLNTIDVQMASPVESESGKDECSKELMQAESAETVQSAEVSDTKVVEAVKEEEPKKQTELDLTAAAAVDQNEQKEANVEQPTKGGAEAPAPGSLAFPLLEHEPTKMALRASRTLVVLGGLPGSGRSFLAQAIADSYQNLCSVVWADDHNVTSADGFKALDEAVITCCGPATGASMVVLDYTNPIHDRLARLAQIAQQNGRVVLFLEPRTHWCRDAAELSKRTGRGLDEAQMQVMKVALEEACIPLFFAWFLLQDKIKCTAMDFLKTLDSLDAFKKHLADFPVETEKEVDLEQYFKSNWSLHCTTKYCGNGKAKGAKEYAEQTAVQDMYGTVSELSLTALFVTPRTVGARVSLSEAQLDLWPADAEKEAEADVPGAGALPPGSRAHISLGCAEKVQPVQTGLDLLDILVLLQSGQQGELVEEMELGSLVYLDKGRWLLTLREPISVQACFSSFYKPKEADETKREPEKKKKAKCSIL